MMHFLLKPRFNYVDFLVLGVAYGAWDSGYKLIAVSVAFLGLLASVWLQIMRSEQ